jgi:hypothetical protein
VRTHVKSANAAFASSQPSAVAQTHALTNRRWGPLYDAQRQRAHRRNQASSARQGSARQAVVRGMAI